jgi:GT2 family glycosyltransferase
VISVVIVAYGSAEALAGTLPALAAELQPGDEVIVVDNGSTDGSAEVAREYGRVIESAENLGFPAACNLGAKDARGELLVFLNPDAVPERGWGEAIRRPLDGPWVGWQGLVVSGGAVNASALEVHFTGVAWASVAHVDTPQEVTAVSGACLAVRAAEFRAIGGFAEGFFLYHEDVDLSLRLRLAGGRLGIEPAARVEHAYEFSKGGYKWRLLERNRWATLVRCWPGPVLAAVAPVLLATELAIWAAALAGGWAPEKARATREAFGLLPEWRRQRRAIQAARRITPATFASWLTPELSSPFLGPAVRASPLLRLYWSLARRAIATRTSPPA